MPLSCMPLQCSCQLLVLIGSLDDGAAISCPYAIARHGVRASESAEASA